MRRFLLVLLAVLIPALAASAQDSAAPTQDQENVVTYAPPTPAATPAAPQIFSRDFTNWQMAIGIQFDGVRLHDQTVLTNTTFHTAGVNGSFVRYFKNWFGLEGQLGTGFGNTGKTTIPNKLVAKSVFFGGGVHISFRSESRLEPWGHVDVGLDHLRFTQGIGPASFTTLGWMAGGGLDYHLNPVMAVRAEADYLGTHFFSRWERNYQIVGAFVVNF